MRATMLPRYWHIVLCVIAGSGIFVLADFFYLNKMGDVPNLKDIWGLAVLVPVLCGAAVTLGARGAIMWKRVVGAAVCGGAVGVLYTAGSGIMGYGGSVEIGEMAISGTWRVFVFTILSTVGMLLTEIKLPEPEK